MTSHLPNEYRELVEEAVEQTLLKLGLDIAQPGSVLELQKDFQHLRKWRVAVGAIESKGALAVIGTLTAGFLAAAWLGIKQLFGGGGS